MALKEEQQTKSSDSEFNGFMSRKGSPFGTLSKPVNKNNAPILTRVGNVVSGTGEQIYQQGVVPLLGRSANAVNNNVIKPTVESLGNAANNVYTGASNLMFGAKNAQVQKKQKQNKKLAKNVPRKEEQIGVMERHKSALKQENGFLRASTVDAYSPEAKQQRNDYYNKNAVDNGDGTTSINMLGGTVSGSNRGMQNMLKGQAKNNRYSLDYLNAIAQQGGSFKDQYDGTPLVENGRVLDNPYGYQENKQSPQENSLNYVRSGSRTALGGGDSSVNMLNTHNQVNNIRDNSQKSVYDAVKNGNISANQGSNLLPRAKLGSDYVSPEQRQAALNTRKTNADINLVNAQASKALDRRTGKPAFTVETLNSLLPIDTSPEVKQRLSTIDSGFWKQIDHDVANAKSQDEVDNIIMQLMKQSGINDPAIFNALIFQGGY